ncbi:nucleotide-binding protein [Roseobacter weihaiensis]|uniref:nucleotide-binding protein n=1 Tax=Roseobacter weihaiensis TaxID=2763262 RepID=UPI001D0BA6D4
MGARLHTVALTGFKGGVGRTTGAAALAHGLAAIGHSVALIDAGHAVPLQEDVVSKVRGSRVFARREPSSKVGNDAGARLRVWLSNSVHSHINSRISGNRARTIVARGVAICRR